MSWLLLAIGALGGRMTDLWGGFLSCLGYLGAIAAIYHKHKCHEPRCWRLAHHPVAGTPYTACRKHHPALPDKAQRGDIAKAFEKARSHM